METQKNTHQTKTTPNTKRQKHPKSSSRVRVNNPETPKKTPTSKQSHITKLKHHLEATNKSPATIQQYTHSIQRYTQYLANKHQITPHQATHKHIQNFIRTQLKNTKPSTKNTYLAAIKVLHQQVIMKPQATQQIKAIRNPRQPVNYLTKKEYQELLETTRNHNIYHGKLELAIQLGYLTGLRATEICSIKKEDINYIRGEITVKGKGNKKRRVVIPPTFQKQLQQYTEKLEHEDELFPDLDRKKLYYYFKKCVKQSNISGSYSVHSLRHGFIMFLLEEKGVSLDEIRVLTGHASIQSLEHYIHTELNEGLRQRTKNIMEKA